MGRAMRTKNVKGIEATRLPIHSIVPCQTGGNSKSKAAPRKNENIVLVLGLVLSALLIPASSLTTTRVGDRKMVAAINKCPVQFPVPSSTATQVVMRMIKIRLDKIHISVLSWSFFAKSLLVNRISIVMMIIIIAMAKAREIQMFSSAIWIPSIA